MKKALLTSLVCFALMVLLVAVSAFAKDPNADHPWIPIAHEVRARAMRELSKKHDLQPCGIGGALMTGVNTLTLAFQVREEMEQDQARVLLVKCTQDFVAIIDESEALRPYLKSSPCPVEVAEIILYFKQPDGWGALLPFVGVAGVHDGAIRYCYNDETTRRKAYKRVDKETFEEALAIVNAADLDVDAPESDA